MGAGVCGYKVPPNYDSMVAKLLVYQPTRAEAIACMRGALAEFIVEGIKTTIPIHREIFKHQLCGRRGGHDVHRAHLATRRYAPGGADSIFAQDN